MAEQCRTCGERGTEGSSLLEPENAPLLQFIIIHLQNKLAGGSFFVCHACVVEIQHWRNFLTRFQTSQTHFHQVLATSDCPQQTTDVSLETKLAKCQVLVTKLLQCDSCSFYTNNKTQLESHMLIHLEATNTADATGSRRPTANEGRILKNHKCALCGTKTVHPEMLSWHTANCHGPDAIVRVSVTGKCVRYQCTFCETMYIGQYCIIWHLRCEHKINNLPFHCNVCSRQFVTFFLAQRHQLNCKTKKSVNRVISLEYKCNECGSKFAHSESLAWHIAYSHGVDAIVNVVKINKIRKYQCNFCQTVCTTQNSIINHLHGKHRISNLPFRCNICDKQFVAISTLRTHLLKCKYTASISGEMECKVHSMKYVEASSGVKCKLCCQIFKTKIEMRNHISNFHGTKLCFKCKHCHQTFPSCNKLFSHCSNNHPGKPVLNCDICNVDISAYTNYVDHKNYIHSGHTLTCKICSATFSSYQTLRNHMRTTHSKETFSCGFCSAKFRCKEYLKRHIRDVHTGPIFHCKHCAYNTRRRANLICHIRKRHF